MQCENVVRGLIGIDLFEVVSDVRSFFSGLKRILLGFNRTFGLKRGLPNKANLITIA